MKAELIDEYRRAVIARRIKHYRSRFGFTQEVLADIEPKLDLKVLKNAETEKAISFNSYEKIAEKLGLSYEQLIDYRMTDLFNSLTHEITELVSIWQRVMGRPPLTEDNFISRFMAMGPDAVENLENMGLIIGEDRYSIFGVMLAYKRDIEREFANFLKAAGFTQEQRLYFHCFVNNYHLLQSTPKDVRRTTLPKYASMMIDALRRLEQVEGQG
jgi:transcriptional regulator with XRE-family HTH domain